jgi:O-antigen/teichoic acid export membrane protein
MMDRINSFLPRALRNQYSWQVATTLAMRAFTLGLSVGVGAITARWLGQEGKGMVVMIILLPNMLGLFLNAGIGVGNAYYAGRGIVSPAVLTRNSLTFGLSVSTLGIVAVGVLAALGLLQSIVPGVSTPYLLLGMVALPVMLLYNILSNVLYGLGRINATNVLNFLQTALVLPLMVILVVWFRMSVLGAVLAQLMAMAAVLALTMFYLRREGCTFRLGWDRAAGRLTFVFGFKAYVGNFLQYFNYRLDTFFVNYYAGTKGAGIYAVAVSVAELLWQFPNAAAYVLFPKSTASSHETMNRVTPRVFWIVLGVTTAAGIFLAVTGRFLIRLVFSDAFIGSYVPCLALVPGVVLLGAARVLTADIAGRGHVLYNTIGCAATLVITVIFDLLLIPPMGVLGAAVASTISYAFFFAISVAFYLFVSRSSPKDLPQVDVINVDCT